MTEEERLENTIEDYTDDLNVLQDVMSAVKKLRPEARQRLLQTVVTFFGIKLESGVGKESPYFHKQEISRPSFSEDRTMSPKEFLLEKKPQTDVEKVACLAYYLTHYRETPHFKTIDISKLNTDAAQRKFSNAAMAVDNATKSGYLVPATKGQKQLSASGELYVQALPDRSAAKEAITQGRPKKKSKGIKNKANNED